MTRKMMKSVLAGALALSSLTTIAAQAGDTLILRRAPDTATIFRAPTIKRMMNLSEIAGILQGGPIMPIKLQFNCVVQGNPVEFPNDIRISNPYSFTVPAGTVASYTAPFGNTGTVVLPALAPGKGVFVWNAVPGGITAGTPCSASQV